jgi:predicted 3-demethylubiquinone-9 3-methyltransferase (glyoxalase superfamily)
MAKSARPFLMFTGQAEEAMRFYVSLFPGAEIVDLTHHPEGGKVMRATFAIAGQPIMCTDSPPVHAFTFTPSSSIFVECDDEAQLRDLAHKLGGGERVMMEVANYGFSTLFTWVADPFGVSWQLNLP